MSVPPFLILFIQGMLLLASLYLFWCSWQIRESGRYDLMKGARGIPLAAPKLIAPEYARYYSAFGLALLAVVGGWAGFGWSFSTATIVTTFVTVVATGWRGKLLRLHDRRLASAAPPPSDPDAQPPQP